MRTLIVGSVPVRRRRGRLAAAGALVAALVAGSLAPAGAAPSGSRATSPREDAVAWLIDQQQDDGGFELAGFPGFETSDAVLALATSGQGDTSWDEADALAAVEAVTTGGNSPLDAIDDLVDTPASAAQAAKVIVLVAVPLGLDVADFDPSDDTAEAVDLLALVRAAAGGDGSYPSVPLGGQATIAWALAALDEPVPAPLLAAIAGAQQANGSFHYSGSPDGAGFDPDLTAAVVTALTVAGRPVDDPTVRRAVVALGRNQRPSGNWATEFDDGNPSSTAMVALAAATLGADPDGTCWRDRAEPRFAGARYRSPSAALTRAQVPEGRIASPNDIFGVNTLATSQAIQALAAADGIWPYAGPACTVAAASEARRLVNAYYLDLLGRFSDEPGAAHWVGRLQSGARPDQVAQALTGSLEYAVRVVRRTVTGLLHRPASLAEETTGIPLVRAGRRLRLVAAALGSPDYLATTVEAPATPTDTTWANAVFADVLGRPADPAGRDWALGRLGAGATREQVAWNLLHSGEGLGHLVDGMYRDLLGRASDAPGRAYWVGRLQAGASPEALVVMIAGSAEYVAATRP